jgi:hypothetical protein
LKLQKEKNKTKKSKERKSDDEDNLKIEPLGKKDAGKISNQEKIFINTNQNFNPNTKLNIIYSTNKIYISPREKIKNENKIPSFFKSKEELGK